MRPLITRIEWVAQCAGRFQERGGLTAKQADEYAYATACVELDDNGPDVARWTDPIEAADSDMSYWENDGDPE